MNNATPYQRAEVARLLQKLEYDHRNLTLMHRNVGAPEPLIQAGAKVDAWLDEMTPEQASALIEKMRGMI
jgi:hypothetical protein